MFKRVRWNIVFGIFFLVIAVLNLADNRWVDAAWSGLLGFGGLFSAVGQRYPRIGRGLVGWTIAIVYVVVLVAVFIVKLRTP
jgi:uncharacterized membrane protein